MEMLDIEYHQKNISNKTDTQLLKAKYKKIIALITS